MRSEVKQSHLLPSGGGEWPLVYTTHTHTQIRSSLRMVILGEGAGTGRGSRGLGGTGNPSVLDLGAQLHGCIHFLKIY